MQDCGYAYGTGPEAAARLGLIADYFNPIALSFIERFAIGRPQTAVDLGCGPGFSTSMLAKATCSVETYGLDQSREFLSMATSRFRRCTFFRHDVTRMPLPVSGDVMYARFLLCHLCNPDKLVEGWASQLNPNGLLFVDDIDSIETSLPVFQQYLEVAQGIVAAKGASLYLRDQLSGARCGVEVLADEVLECSVMNGQAASWFLPNVKLVWPSNEHVRRRLQPAMSRAIRQELERLATGGDTSSDITWRLRRLVLRKPQSRGGSGTRVSPSGVDKLPGLNTGSAAVSQ